MSFNNYPFLMKYAARYYCMLVNRRIRIYKMKYLSARCQNPIIEY